MKILVVTQYYWPENSRVTDIVESLQEAGNEITVLTGLPNYPEGYIYDGYKKGKNRKEVHNGIKIIRAKLIERRHDSFHRLLNYYSFPFFANKIVKKMPNDFDVVLAFEESPIMLVLPAIKYAKRNNKKLIMYEMDLWPESLLAGGITKHSIIYNYFKKVSSKIYSSCDKIVVSTKEHIDYIKQLPKCNDLDIEYLAQYAEPIFEKETFSSIDNETIDLMFAGNIGKAQSVCTIVKAASLLSNDNRFKFHIVGDGSDFLNVKKIANDLGLKNIVFYGKKPLPEMPQMYDLADAMLVTLEDKPYANMTIPGKVQSYMAAGKAVIGCANGSCANFIINNQIGYACNAGDYKALANTLKELDLEELSIIGKRSKAVYEKKYHKTVFVGKLIKILNEAIGNTKQI